MFQTLSLRPNPQATETYATCGVDSDRDDKEYEPEESILMIHEKKKIDQMKGRL